MTWLLPTRRRPGNLKRLFRACREYGSTTPCLILVNDDEWAELSRTYEALDRPERWRFVPVKAASMHEALRQAWPLVKDEPWIGLLQDDLVPATPAWDERLVGALQGWNAVSAHDGIPHDQRMHGAIAWSGDLVRELGWLYPPTLKHLYGDDVWEQLSGVTRCWKVMWDVVTRHHNETYRPGGDETAAHIRGFTECDKAAFEVWRRDEFDVCVAKIKALQKRKGVFHYHADFKGVHILLATPTASGWIEAGYVDSVFELAERVNQGGGSVKWVKERRNSDISLARARLLSEFLRTTCTHMLLIDDDMGWEWPAIVRLFAARKDFVAVAGPKKFYPLTFAANYSDDNGNMIPFRVDTETGCAEVHEIGLAFALLTRACAERIAKTYPDLDFEDATGNTVHAVFNPMVIRRRYFSEDFAFCKRWRLIGGKAHICPDVPLSHTGDHTFRGALSDHNAVKKIPGT